MDYPLVLTRAVHFAATVSLSGSVIFCGLVAGPTLGPAARSTQSEVRRLYRRLSLVFWISLALALLSGTIWFGLVAADIGDRSFGQIFDDDLAWSVLADTGFGQVWAARVLIGVLLAVIVRVQSLDVVSFTQMALAACFLAGLAWAGHGAATPGTIGNIHLGSDVLHLVAVGAWVGGLVPFALLLTALRTQSPTALQSSVVDATRSFSTIGLAAVGTICATGAVNTWILVGSANALLSTGYGRLLLLKLVLFTAMVVLAAVNRWRLSAQLPGSAARLERNTLIEVVLGLLILCIVGALGITAPGLDGHAGHLN